MEFAVRFYATPQGDKPLAEFLRALRTKHAALHSLIVGGIKKLEQRRHHGPPLTELVDSDHGIFELRVGDTNIARVFFFFRPGREIILTNGYVKKSQKVDRNELELARRYKQDWEKRYP
jgi:hypothetical protein